MAPGALHTYLHCVYRHSEICRWPRTTRPAYFESKSPNGLPELNPSEASEAAIVAESPGAQESETTQSDSEEDEYLTNPNRRK